MLVVLAEVVRLLLSSASIIPRNSSIASRMHPAVPQKTHHPIVPHLRSCLLGWHLTVGWLSVGVRFANMESFLPFVSSSHTALNRAK